MEALAMSQEHNQHRSVRNAPGLEVAVLAGGCFWGVEEILRGVPGIVDTEVVTPEAGWRIQPTTTLMTASQATPRQYGSRSTRP